MHELSIAQNIIDSIYDTVGEERLPYVFAVNVDIGAASGVVADSLLFAFDAIKEDAHLSSAGLQTTIIPFIVQCNECGKSSENDAGLMICCECGSTDVAVISGTELVLKQIELKDP